MDIVDHVLILMLFLVQPLYGAYESKQVKARAEAGEVLDRAKFYRDTAIMEWAFLAVLMAVWFFYGRPFEALGFVEPGGVGFWAGAGVLALVVAGLLYSWRAALKMNDAERAKNVESYGDMAIYLPQSRRDLKYFTAVSATAGVVEEIVYRGFVMWYLGLIMPLWAAALVSSIAFGLAHSYQGRSGAIRCGLIGLAFAVFYLVTGSIWLPILGHILLDALQGPTLREMFRRSEPHAAAA